MLGTGGEQRDHGREERLLPRRARAGIDRRGTLSAAGLLASADPAAARALMAAEVGDFFEGTEKHDEEEEDVNVAP